VKTTKTRQPARAAPYKVIVIGGSAGSFEGLRAIFAALFSDFELPVLVVQHLHPSDGGAFARHLARITRFLVVEPCDKERIEPGRVYTAPADYHMLVERDWTISLSVDEKVNWSRPSIDVLFESAAVAWGEAVVAVLLSGASVDGAKGMRSVRDAGGLTIAQDPNSAEYPFMPQSAIDSHAVAEVLRAEEIGRLLAGFGTKEKA
jgi:two-component system, chemotaxis family, protein-glutamate methylesterase/glutaminase